ncbi:MAG: Unknown protein [uncultured Sulfurovum sp.]|uniref:Uncharacterized protein n=1 Tax=uncultured Sulfurovum sp. TaxID=269237 RepID=A0A6S6TV17_9BACT|nr:MAG: Unknown protein [uncultured Sulfurovum sp.]
MIEENKEYTFPWGFQLGTLYKDETSIPLYTTSEDGGFCILYDKESEPKVDLMLESLSLQLLSSMPTGSLEVDLFDFGKKKFYHLSPLQHVQLFKTAYTSEMINDLFKEIENTIVTRYTELICCNRPSINAHNQKSKLKQKYHVVLMNLANFPTEETTLREIENFVESAQKAGVYVIAFGYHDIEKNENLLIQVILQHFKTLKVRQNIFEITNDIFEFPELLDDHNFTSLDLDKSTLMEETLSNANLETFMNPDSIKLEENTKVK